MCSPRREPEKEAFMNFLTHRKLLLAAVLIAVPVVQADEPKPEKGTAVAESVTETASLLSRDTPDKPWQIVKEKQAIAPGQLILGMLHGAVANKSVKVAVFGDPDGTSPLPILETAFSLQDEKGVDLSVTLDRGRVVLTNLKEKDPATVRLHIRDWTGDVVLVNPGTQVMLTLFGRWPRGVPFNKDAKPEDGPPLAWTVLVLKGEVQLKGPKSEVAMKAPPGPALFEGDSIGGPIGAPEHLDKLPDWATENPDSERGKKIKALAARIHKDFAEKSIDEAIGNLMASKEVAEQRAAVVLLAAMDNLKGIGEVLGNARSPEVWDMAVIVMRNWIGRGPGQDLKLYQALINIGKYTPVEAEAVLYLLHSFGDDDLKHPETYQLLVKELESERLAIRGLANWHLIRLVPAGRKFGYDPLAPKEERAKAAADWRKLIPPGKLPPAPKDPEK
jgi:hypothetical protein